MGGLLTKVFLRDLRRYPPYPIRDPRLAEAMGLYPEASAPMSARELEPPGESPQLPRPSEGGGR